MQLKRQSSDDLDMWKTTEKVVKEDVHTVGVAEEDAEDRVEVDDAEATPEEHTSAGKERLSILHT